MNIERHDGEHELLPQCDGEAGQTMVEYGFVVVAVALAALTAYQLFGGRVNDLVNTVTW